MNKTKKGFECWRVQLASDWPPIAVNEARVFSAKPKQSRATSDQLKIALEQ